MQVTMVVQLLHIGEILTYITQHLDLTMHIVMEELHVQVFTQQHMLKDVYLKIILQKSGAEHYIIGQEN